MGRLSEWSRHPLANAWQHPYNPAMGGEITTIREAAPGDAPAIARVHEEAWRATYQGIIPHHHLMRMIARRGPEWWARAAGRAGGLLLLIFDGQVQGYASFGKARMPYPETGEIFELYLAPTFQGVGFGKRLFLAASRDLEQRGLHSLIVWALAENQPACDFYVRLGGKPGITTPERYGRVTLSRVAFFWPARP